MAKRTTSEVNPNRVNPRERLKREISVLKAIGMPPRLLLARGERTVRQRIDTHHGDVATAVVSDASAVRSLAKHVRGQMQRELDVARRELLMQVKQLNANSPASQVEESMGMLSALRWFDPTGHQLDEAEDSLNKLVYGDPPPPDKSGGAQRRTGC